MAEKRIEAGPLATQVAQTIREVRKRQGITYAELSERLTQAGRPIPELGLSRMEKGDRRIDLDDLVALARALRVPPVWLIFPLGKDAPADIDMAPGVSVPMEAALAWFVGDSEAFTDHFGRGAFDPDSHLYEWYELPDGIDGHWSDEARPLWLYRQHRRLVDEWHQTWSRANRAGAGAQPVGQFVFTLAALTEENLRSIRNEMRRQGLPLPNLPEGGLRERFAAKQGGDGGDKKD